MNSIHYVIDAVKGKHPHKLQKRHVIDPFGKQEFLEMAQKAVCYDFGELIPNEEKSDKSIHRYQIDVGLTNLDLQALEEGLLPLPSEVCWFEYTLNTRSAVLVDMKDGRLNTTMIACDLAHPVCVDMVWATLEEERRIVVDCKNRDLLRLIYSKMSDDQLKLIYTSMIPLTIFFLKRLHNRAVEIKKWSPDNKENKQLIWEKKTPKREYNIVTINPTKVVIEDRPEPVGTHASPVFHIRRQHTRTIHRGTEKERVIPIAEMKVGDPTKGAPVKKEYVVK